MNQSASNIFANSLKSIIKGFLKIFTIGFAWLLKIIGVTLTKMGEALERIIVKRSSL